MDIAGQLKGTTLFKGVSEADTEALIRAMRRENYPAGAVLFHKGELGDTMYIILSGRIRIYMPEAEGELTLRYYGPTDLFGEFSPLDQKPRSASAAAAEPLEVLALDRSHFLAFLEQRPLVGLEMMRSLVERLRYTTEYLQRVMDAIQSLSRGETLELAALPDATDTDKHMQSLISTFVQMVQSVQAREQTLAAPDSAVPPISAPTEDSGPPAVDEDQ